MKEYKKTTLPNNHHARWIVSKILISNISNYVKKIMYFKTENPIPCGVPGCIAAGTNERENKDRVTHWEAGAFCYIRGRKCRVV